MIEKMFERLQSLVVITLFWLVMAPSVLGVNIKRLDSIIFASPSKSKIRNLQSIGRVLRKGNGKDKATLYDIVDDLQWKSKKNFAVQHFMERVKIYSEEGFEFKIYNIYIGE